MKDFFVSHFWCRNRFFLLHGQESLNGQILTLFRLRNVEILLFPCKKCVFLQISSCYSCSIRAGPGLSVFVVRRKPHRQRQHRQHRQHRHGDATEEDDSPRDAQEPDRDGDHE